MTIYTKRTFKIVENPTIVDNFQSTKLSTIVGLYHMFTFKEIFVSKTCVANIYLELRTDVKFENCFPFMNKQRYFLFNKPETKLQTMTASFL